jgi:hypothetical protein
MTARTMMIRTRRYISDATGRRFARGRRIDAVDPRTQLTDDEDDSDTPRVPSFVFG